jgi:pyridoxal phosphate enzyme (YggS family)
MSAPDIHQNLEAVRARLRSAASLAGREASDIRLIAVSKYMPPAYVQLAMAAGQHCFAENTVQGALTKQPLLEDPVNEWHFIGHLQTNKAKRVPGLFDWLHTLDSLKLAGRLSASAIQSSITLKVLLQVNIAGDPAKSGLPANDVYRFVDELLQADLAGIRLSGLMTIGRHSATPSERRADFSALRRLRDACADRFGGALFEELSMGMSNDFELAIAEGATMIRVGSSIFGPRPAPATHLER